MLLKDEIQYLLTVFIVMGSGLFTAELKKLLVLYMQEKNSSFLEDFFSTEQVKNGTSSQFLNRTENQDNQWKEIII